LLSVLSHKHLGSGSKKNQIKRESGAIQFYGPLKGSDPTLNHSGAVPATVCYYSYIKSVDALVTDHFDWEGLRLSFICL